MEVSIWKWWLIIILVGGWPTPLKNDGVSNSWDDEIHNIWENNPNVPNHQPVYNHHIPMVVGLYPMNHY